MNGVISKGFRCAVYTRKSTEHNLDLAFTSLDAQRAVQELGELRPRVSIQEGASIATASLWRDGGTHYPAATLPIAITPARPGSGPPGSLQCVLPVTAPTQIGRPPRHRRVATRA